MTFRAKNFQTRALLEKGRADETTPAEVSVIVYYTREFAQTTTDVEGHIDGLINQANDAYRRTFVPVTLRLHCIQQSGSGENPDPFQRLREFANSQGGKHVYRASRSVVQ